MTVPVRTQPETPPKRRYIRNEPQANQRRLDYEFYEQLDCLDEVGAPSGYEDMLEGAD